MKKNTALKEALKKAGVTKEAFKPDNSVKPKKKKRDNVGSWKAGTKSSHKLRKAQNQTPGKKTPTGGKKKIRKTKKRVIKSPTYMDGQHLESVYGGGKIANDKNKAKTKKPKNKISCHLPEPLSRSPIFDNKYKKQSNLLVVSDPQLWQSQERDTNSVNPIVIGLDFGTSSTKVVMQDVARRAYAVPFTDASQNPYLLPAKVYESQDVFSLEPAKKCYRDLKLILIQDHVDQLTLVPAVAYMALVIRHCQGWLWDNHEDIYARDSIIWGLNLGLPAASYENTRLVERFLAMAIAARQLAESDLKEMNTEVVFDAIKNAYHEIKETKQNDNDLAGAIKEKYPVSVYPEIAAQVFGFVRSTSWDSRDRPMMMMVDIGAGTVDASIFTVMQPKKGRRSFNFFGNNVRGNGVMNLHRARLQWLRQLINNSGHMSEDVEQYFCEIEIPTDRLMPIPEAVIDYIPGMEVELVGYKDIDEQFYNRYSTQLHHDTIARVRDTKDNSQMQWRNLPFFLCGGGKKMKFYKRFAKSMNRSGSTSISLEVLELPKPDRLEAKGLMSGEFHRLSVAYGLSFDDIGDFVKPEKIPDISRKVEKPTWRDKYVDKDQV